MVDFRDLKEKISKHTLSTEKAVLAHIKTCNTTLDELNGLLAGYPQFTQEVIYDIADFFVKQPTVELADILKDLHNTILKLKDNDLLQDDEEVLIAKIHLHAEGESIKNKTASMQKNLRTGKGKERAGVSSDIPTSAVPGEISAHEKIASNYSLQCMTKILNTDLTTISTDKISMLIKIRDGFCSKQIQTELEKIKIFENVKEIFQEEEKFKTDVSNIITKIEPSNNNYVKEIEHQLVKILELVSSIQEFYSNVKSVTLNTKDFVDELNKNLIENSSAEDLIVQCIYLRYFLEILSVLEKKIHEDVIEEIIRNIVIISVLEIIRNNISEFERYWEEILRKYNISLPGWELITDKLLNPNIMEMAKPPSFTVNSASPQLGESDLLRKNIPVDSSLDRRSRPFSSSRLTKRKPFLVASRNEISSETSFKKNKNIPDLNHLFSLTHNPSPLPKRPRFFEPNPSVASGPSTSSSPLQQMKERIKEELNSTDLIYDPGLSDRLNTINNKEKLIVFLDELPDFLSVPLDVFNTIKKELNFDEAFPETKNLLDEFSEKLEQFLKEKNLISEKDKTEIYVGVEQELKYMKNKKNTKMTPGNLLKIFEKVYNTVMESSHTQYMSEISTNSNNPNPPDKSKQPAPGTS